MRHRQAPIACALAWTPPGIPVHVVCKEPAGHTTGPHRAGRHVLQFADEHDPERKVRPGTPSAPATPERLEDAMVPLDTLPTRFGVSRATIARWLTADAITTHAIPGARNNERAVRWGDIPISNARSTRWNLHR